MSEETIYDHLKKDGISRRDFMKLCGMLAGAIGLSKLPPLESSNLPAGLNQVGNSTVDRIAHALETQPRVPVIWLEFQDCAGCSEALTR
ncbi:MAG: twin-arginine translocation signal domain-containing protein, partial [Anaerolineales bacterium]